MYQAQKSLVYRRQALWEEGNAPHRFSSNTFRRIVAKHLGRVCRRIVLFDRSTNQDHRYMIIGFPIYTYETIAASSFIVGMAKEWSYLPMTVILYVCWSDPNCNQ